MRKTNDVLRHEHARASIGHQIFMHSTKWKVSESDGIVNNFSRLTLSAAVGTILL